MEFSQFSEQSKPSKKQEMQDPEQIIPISKDKSTEKLLDITNYVNYGSKIFEKYLNEFNIPEHSKPLVREIYNRLTEVINVEGRNPHTVCGAAIVLS